MNLKVGMSIKLPSKETFLFNMGQPTDDATFSGKFTATFVDPMYDDLGTEVTIVDLVDNTHASVTSDYYNGTPFYIHYVNNRGGSFSYDISALFLSRIKMRRKHVVSTRT